MCDRWKWRRRDKTGPEDQIHPVTFRNMSVASREVVDVQMLRESRYNGIWTQQSIISCTAYVATGQLPVVARTSHVPRRFDIHSTRHRLVQARDYTVCTLYNKRTVITSTLLTNLRRSYNYLEHGVKHRGQFSHTWQWNSNFIISLTFLFFFKFQL